MNPEAKGDGWVFQMGLHVLPLPGETEDLWKTAVMS